MEFTAYDIGLIPLMMAIVEILKTSFKIPARFIPLITIVLGEVAAFVYVSPDDVKVAVLSGLVMAFTAMGMWSGTKNTVGR
jgi:hypothetical protein